MRLSCRTQFNGREGETATFLSRCLFNSTGLGGGFAPRHLSRYMLRDNPNEICPQTLTMKI